MRRERATLPDLRDIRDICGVIGTLSSSCIACRENDYEVAAARWAEMETEIREAWERIMGNRKQSVPPTWDDMRLLLEATMRRCLGYLERDGEA